MAADGCSAVTIPDRYCRFELKWKHFHTLSHNIFQWCGGLIQLNYTIVFQNIINYSGLFIDLCIDVEFCLNWSLWSTNEMVDVPLKISNQISSHDCPPHACLNYTGSTLFSYWYCPNLQYFGFVLLICSSTTFQINNAAEGEAAEVPSDPSRPW